MTVLSPGLNENAKCSGTKKEAMKYVCLFCNGETEPKVKRRNLFKPLSKLKRDRTSGAPEKERAGQQGRGTSKCAETEAGLGGGMVKKNKVNHQLSSLERQELV